jgi:hypothetical protein
MNRRFVACGVAYALACTAAIAAQDPQTQNPRPSAAAAPTTEAVTVEGCLLREADVPGRRPPEAERQRVRADDDYILSDAKMIKGTAPAPVNASGTPVPAGTAGTSGSVAADPKPIGSSGAVVTSPLMFDVEQIDKAQLSEHRGKRVQIDGTFKHTELAANAVSPATDLVELHGTAIRVVEGACPSAK